jgi:uncharacterized membrane protein YdjX (TVP38/TMEM64 family)
MATRGLLGLLLIASVVGYFAFGLDRHFSVAGFRMHLGTVLAWRDADPLRFGLLYFLTFVLAAGLSFPGAVMLALPAGPLFGLFWGTVIVSFASTIGAWLAFLSARYLLREPVRRWFGDRLQATEQGLARDGAFYLLTLRMAPVVPYFIANLLMGLTPMGAMRYCVVSQLGMLPGTVLFINVGDQLARVERVEQVLTPTVWASFLLLGLFPWAMRHVFRRLGRRGRGQVAV